MRRTQGTRGGQPRSGTAYETGRGDAFIERERLAELSARPRCMRDGSTRRAAPQAAAQHTTSIRRTALIRTHSASTHASAANSHIRDTHTESQPASHGRQSEDEASSGTPHTQHSAAHDTTPHHTAPTAATATATQPACADNTPESLTQHELTAARLQPPLRILLVVSCLLHYAHTRTALCVTRRDCFTSQSSSGSSYHSTAHSNQHTPAGCSPRHHMIEQQQHCPLIQSRLLHVAISLLPPLALPLPPAPPQRRTARRGIVALEPSHGPTRPLVLIQSALAD